MKNKIVSCAVSLLRCWRQRWPWPRPNRPRRTLQIAAFPGALVNARYVYVTSYDGDQFNINLLPDDRQAIAAVQDALQKWASSRWCINHGGPISC